MLNILSLFLLSFTTIASAALVNENSIVRNSIESTCFKDYRGGATSIDDCFVTEINDVYFGACPAGGYTQVDTWLMVYLSQSGEQKHRRYKKESYVELSRFFGRSTESMDEAKLVALKNYFEWARTIGNNGTHCE